MLYMCKKRCILSLCVHRANNFIEEYYRYNYENIIHIGNIETEKKKKRELKKYVYNYINYNY